MLGRPEVPLALNMAGLLWAASFGTALGGDTSSHSCSAGWDTVSATPSAAGSAPPFPVEGGVVPLPPAGRALSGTARSPSRLLVAASSLPGVRGGIAPPAGDMSYHERETIFQSKLLSGVCRWRTWVPNTCTHWLQQCSSELTVH